MILGLNEQEWKELKQQQYEFNRRNMKIIEKMEKQYEDSSNREKYPNKKNPTPNS